MNILFISRELSGGDMAYRLKKEGHAVKLYIEDKDQRQNLQGIIEKTYDWRRELSWVGKDGLIIFDDTGYGRIQDRLRRQGFSVIGGSEGGDKAEDYRDFGQEVLSSCGVETVPCISFEGAQEAIRFVEKNKGPWVIKQNGHASKGFNYVGQLESGEDVIQVLRNYNLYNREDCYLLALHKKIEGIEIGVGRYFNGSDWVGPIEINIEHKNLCNGGLGPKTQEMGTLLWYDDNEDNRLFQATLAKLKPYLQEVDFRGDVDINCIVNEHVAYPLEITARFGWPATHIHEEIHLSPWGEFLKAVADGKQYNLRYKMGYGIVILIATPPFPYTISSRKYSPEGLGIFFKKKISEEEMNHFHFEEISLRKKKGVDTPYVSSKTGSILHITETGNTVEEAREKVYALASNVIIPKMFYRTDIGVKFARENREKLKKWGWIS